MKGKRPLGAILALVPLPLVSPAHAQESDSGVYWHVDPRVEDCSMVIDPSLTQDQWRKFTREGGSILSFKSLASAEPAGRLGFSLGVDYSTTPVDQRDPAWINTFTHPDADCPLGDEIVLPTIRARFGVSNSMDVSCCWTKAPEANYGLVGGEIKHVVRKESPRAPAVAASASVVILTGVPDFDVGVYSVGVLASKRVSVLTPYLGVKQSLAVGTETTSKVDLGRETVPITQAVIGASYSIWKVGLAAEYDVAPVNTFAFVVGFRS